jgi:calcium-dependent protein kinase
MGQEISAVANSAADALSMVCRERRVSIEKVLSQATSASKAAVTASRFHPNGSGRSLEDDYELESSLVLGKGSSAKVVLARGRVNRQKYAVKTMHRQHVRPEELEMGVSEVEIFLMLDHPNIVRLHDVYYDGDGNKMHLVMECCTGGELFYRVLDKGPLPEHEAALALGQMLRAVGYLHAHGIVHRDLKPENFLYESKQKGAPLKLIDFGFGEMWDPKTLMRQCCGTLSYVSPEVLSQEGYTDKCDMWSLGVIAFVILMGYPPFQGEDDGDVKLKIKAGEVDRQLTKHYSTWLRWSALPADAQELVKALLVKDPAERLSAQKAIFHPWLIREQATGMGTPALDMQLFRSLRSYRVMQPLQRAVWQLMSQQLRPAQTRRATEMFLSLDVENTGMVNLSDFKDAFCRARLLPPETEGALALSTEEVEEICDLLDDVWGEEGIPYSEFIAATGLEAPFDAKIIRSAFHRLDVDQSGFLNVLDVEQAFGGVFDRTDVEDWICQAETAAEWEGEVGVDQFLTYVRSEGITPLSAPLGYLSAPVGYRHWG